MVTLELDPLVLEATTLRERVRSVVARDPDAAKKALRADGMCVLRAFAENERHLEKMLRELRADRNRARQARDAAADVIANAHDLLSRLAPLAC